MNKRSQHSVPAFTIFEVTVVLAIMSVLIGIISTSMNRFNEQLKTATEVHAELNHWRAVRSVIWTDFYTADSIRMEASELSIFRNGEAVKYKAENEFLQRFSADQWRDLRVPLEQIYVEQENETAVYHMSFPWKGAMMDLSYHHQPAIAGAINEFFDKRP